jgi:hypothetical protein
MDDDASSVSGSEAFSTAASQGSSNFWSLSSGIAAELAGLRGIAVLDTLGERREEEEEGEEEEEEEGGGAAAAGADEAAYADAGGGDEAARAPGVPFPLTTSHQVALSAPLRALMSGPSFYLWKLRRASLRPEEQPSLSRAYYELRAACEEHAAGGAPPSIFCVLTRAQCAATVCVKLPEGGKLKTVCTAAAQMDAERQALVVALQQLRRHVAPWRAAAAAAAGGRAPDRAVVVVSKSGQAAGRAMEEAQRLREALEAQMARAAEAERRLSELLLRVERGGGGGGGGGGAAPQLEPPPPERAPPPPPPPAAGPATTPRSGWAPEGGERGGGAGWGGPLSRSRWGQPGQEQRGGAGWGGRRARSRSRERRGSKWEGAPPDATPAPPRWVWDGAAWVLPRADR